MHLLISLVVCLIALTQAAPQFSGYEYNQQQGGGNKNLPPAGVPQEPIIHKQFYSIAAPEDPENQGKVKHFTIGRPQKNYRVVFIKAPSSDNANVKLSAQYAPQEEKTVIYVLSKKDNELNVNDIAAVEHKPPSKPEVFFIKYKTEAEAQHAQKEIQEQYNKLGGTNEYSDEGIAPLTSVVGSLDGGAPDGSFNYKPVYGNENAEYLPPVQKSN